MQSVQDHFHQVNLLLSESQAQAPNRVDVLIGICIAVIVGVTYFKFGFANGEFYQREFMPAVLYACGNGFTNIDNIPPSLNSFLQLNTSTFSCSDLPIDLEYAEPNNFQVYARYLILCTSIVWWFTGVSWDAIIYLCSLLLIISCIAGFVLFRLVMGRLASFGATLFLYTHLDPYVNHLRDYSKVPFSLIIIAILLYLVISKFDGKKLLACSVICGITLGLGYGFRSDLIIFIFPFVGTVCFFLDGKLTQNLLWKGGGLTIFFLALYLSVLPILLGGSAATGSSTVHVILLGLMTHFDSHVGIIPSIYDWGHHYNDGYISAVVAEYGVRVLEKEGDIPLGSAVYDDVSLYFYLEILKTYQADMLTRFASVVYQIIDLPIVRTELLAKFSIKPEVGSGPDIAIGILNSFSSYFVSIALLMVISRNLRIGLFLLVATMYLGGVPFFQYQERHFFYLAVLPIMATFFISHYFLTNCIALFYKSKLEEKSSDE